MGTAGGVSPGQSLCCPVPAGPCPAPRPGDDACCSAGCDSADSLLSRRKGISCAGTWRCRLALGASGAAVVGSCTCLAGAKSPLPGCWWVRGSGAGGMAWECLQEWAPPQGRQQQQQQPRGLAVLCWHHPGPGYLPLAAFHPCSLPLRDLSLLLASSGGDTRLDGLMSFPCAWELRGRGMGRPSTAGRAGERSE